MPNGLETKPGPLGPQVVYPWEKQVAPEITGPWTAYGITPKEYLDMQGKAVGRRVELGLLSIKDAKAYLAQLYADVTRQRLTGERAAIESVQRDRVLMARENFNKSIGTILDAPMSYEEKQDSLLNLYYAYSEEAMLPEDTPQTLQNLAFETLPPEEQQKRRWGPPEPARRAVAPRVEPPRYEPAFEEMRAGLQGPQPWRQWFEQSYSRILSQYKVGEAEPTEKGWAEYLKRKKPELKEEWWQRGAWARGERPAAFAPRITTVRF